MRSVSGVIGGGCLSSASAASSEERSMLSFVVPFTTATGVMVPVADARRSGSGSSGSDSRDGRRSTTGIDEDGLIGCGACGSVGAV